jgi:hypothetical protein
VIVSPFADAGGGFTTLGGARVSTERAGYSVRASAAELGAASGNIVYDLYARTFSEYLASLDWYATRTLTLGAEYDYYKPTFDADSIWNWFSHSGMTTALTRGRLALSRQLELSTSLGFRRFRTEGDPSSYADVPDRTQSGSRSDLLSSLNGRYSWQSGSVALRSLAEAGQSGHRTGADVTTTERFEEGLYDARVTLSLYDWHDDLRPSRDATSFTYAVGGGMTPFGQTRLGLEWEHSVNRLVGQRFRLLLAINFTVLQ